MPRFKRLAKPQEGERGGWFCWTSGDNKVYCEPPYESRRRSYSPPPESFSHHSAETASADAAAIASADAAVLAAAHVATRAKADSATRAAADAATRAAADAAEIAAAESVSLVGAKKLGSKRKASRPRSIKRGLHLASAKVESADIRDVKEPKSAAPETSKRRRASSKHMAKGKGRSAAAPAAAASASASTTHRPAATHQPAAKSDLDEKSKGVSSAFEKESTSASRVGFASKRAVSDAGERRRWENWRDEWHTLLTTSEIEEAENASHSLAASDKKEVKEFLPLYVAWGYRTGTTKGHEHEGTERRITFDKAMQSYGDVLMRSLWNLANFGTITPTKYAADMEGPTFEAANILLSDEIGWAESQPAVAEFVKQNQALWSRFLQLDTDARSMPFRALIFSARSLDAIARNKPAHAQQIMQHLAALMMASSQAPSNAGGALLPHLVTAPF